MPAKVSDLSLQIYFHFILDWIHHVAFIRNDFLTILLYLLCSRRSTSCSRITQPNQNHTFNNQTRFIYFPRVTNVESNRIKFSIVEDIVSEMPLPTVIECTITGEHIRLRIYEDEPVSFTVSGYSRRQSKELYPKSYSRTLCYREFVAGNHREQIFRTD